MQFSKVIGEVDPNLVKRAEKVLTANFLDMALRYNNMSVGTQLGGDPFIYTLMFPIQHVCTMNLPTAATDGKVFYWNPKFVLKQTAIGLRMISAHEAWHAIYMHPSRLNRRNPKLWNICVDYIVNWNVMDDIRSRGLDSVKYFKEYLGDYKTVDEFAEILRNPFKALDALKAAGYTIKTGAEVKLPHPNEDVKLSDAQKKSIEDSLQAKTFFYADPNIDQDKRRPEVLYDFFMSLLPKCPDCGKLGMYKKPKSGKNQSPGAGGKNKDKNKGDKGDKQDKGDGSDQGQEPGQCNDPNHSHGPDGSPCDHDGDGQQGQGNSPGQGQSSGGQCDHGGCGTCGGDGDEYFDVFSLGGTVDDHMPAEEGEEQLTSRIADAMETASKLAGKVPASLEDEIGKLTAPTMSWKDVIRGRIRKAKMGNTKNDWTSFKTRPLFCGVMTPKKVSYASRWGCLLDTSGSMSQDDIAFGISQLQSLDREDEGIIVPADAEIYWDQATIIRQTNAENLRQTKIVGRGGTLFGAFFTDYKKEIGDCDFLILITDGYLCDFDVANMVNPGIDVVWLVTSNSGFTPPFGRAYHLREDC